MQKENKTVESLGSKVWKKINLFMLSNLKMKEWLDWVVPSERAVSLCLKDIWKITKPSSWTISKVRETAFFCLLQICQSKFNTLPTKILASYIQRQKYSQNFSELSIWLALSCFKVNPILKILKTFPSNNKYSE